MKFTIASSSLLLAGLATASSSTITSSSASFTPIRSVPYIISSYSLPPYSAEKSSSAIPSASRSSILAAESSAAAWIIHSDEYDCAYQDYGCNWHASDYTGGNDYCGSSSFTTGQKLSDGHTIIAISKDGAGDCASKAGNQCCNYLARDPCKRGEKYLDCVKP